MLAKVVVVVVAAVVGVIVEEVQHAQAAVESLSSEVAAMRQELERVQSSMQGAALVCHRWIVSEAGGAQ